MPGVGVHEPGAGVRDVRRAWWSLALFPVTFVAAFGVGEGLASLLGHPTGSSDDAPVWLMLAAGVPALRSSSCPRCWRWCSAGGPMGRAIPAAGSRCGSGWGSAPPSCSSTWCRACWPCCSVDPGYRACDTLDMLKSGTRSAGVAVREK